MRRRIVAAIVTVAVLAVVAFGVPLGATLRREYEGQARLRLERAAILAERDIPTDWRAGDPPRIDEEPADAVFGVYDDRGALVAGRGPAVADAPVRTALGDQVGEAVGSTYVIVVPIVRGDAIVGALRAEQDRAVVDRRVRVAWARMAVLAVAVCAGAYVVARRLARRIAVPIDALRANAQHLGTDGSMLATGRSGLPEVGGIL